MFSALSALIKRVFLVFRYHKKQINIEKVSLKLYGEKFIKKVSLYIDIQFK